MSKYISLLRGINVGGRRKILMVDLKEVYKQLGFSNVQTYIQSGNVWFETKSNEKPENIATQIAKSIKEKYDFEVPAILRSTEEMSKILDDNPFLKEENVDIKKLHVTFLADMSNESELEAIKTFNYEPDRFEIIGKEVFIYCEDKYHKSKLSNTFFEKKLKVTTTTRNWKTVGKLVELMNK